MAEEDFGQDTRGGSIYVLSSRAGLGRQWQGKTTLEEESAFCGRGLVENEQGKADERQGEEGKSKGEPRDRDEGSSGRLCVRFSLQNTRFRRNADGVVLVSSEILRVHSM